MIVSPHLRIEGYDAYSWTELVSFFLPGLRARIDPGDAAAGTLLVVVDGEGIVLSAVHTSSRDASELHGKALSDDLEAVADAARARRVLVLREGTMEDLAERIGLTATLSGDYVAQALDVLRAVRSAMDADQLRLWPNPAAGVPIPPAGAIERALDAALPKGRTMVLVVYEEGPGAAPPANQTAIQTAAVLRRSDEGAFDWLVGPELLREWIGPTGGDWRRDFRIVVESVTRHAGEVHFGVFLQASTLESLLREADPGAWAREAAVRNVIFNPMPPALALALGADAVRGIGRLSSRALGGIDFASQLLPFANQLRAQLLAVRTVTDELGFDPLRMLAAVLRTSDEASEK
ncbi:MAG: hypothetical protein AAF645_08550 [Myxococcota bacterium]